MAGTLNTQTPVTTADLRRRARPSLPQRMLQHGRIWRLRFTRQKFIHVLKSLVWVVPLTVLIWIYAEREQILTPTKNVLIQFYSSDKSKIVLPGSNTGSPQVVLKLSGRADSLEQFNEQLGSGIQLDVADIGIGTNIPVNILSRHLENLPLFKALGISVTESTPEYLPVTVDNLDQISVPVQPPPDVTNVSSATFDPGEVQVSGPQSLLNLRKNTLKAQADIRDAAKNLTGSQVLTDVPLHLSDPDPHFTFSPTKVKATLDIRPAAVKGTLASVLVLVQAPPALLEEYYVKVEPTHANVVVTGPAETISRLTDQLATPQRAILNITNEDKSPGEHARALDYHLLPADVKVAPESAAEPVTFTLVPRGSNG